MRQRRISSSCLLLWSVIVGFIVIGKTPLLAGHDHMQHDDNSNSLQLYPIPNNLILSQNNSTVTGEEDFFSEEDVDKSDYSGNKESMFHFGGYLKHELAYKYNNDDHGWRKFRTNLSAGVDITFNKKYKAKCYWRGFYDFAYLLEGRDTFDDETLDVYEYESELHETYFDGEVTNWFRFKIGRQIINWGNSDFDQIVDMANPRDERELLQIDVDDARIPVGAIKLSFVFQPFELNLVSIHETRPNKIGKKGSDFDRFIESRQESVIIDDEEVPSVQLKNTEYLARLFGSFSGFDFSFIFADTYDDSAYLDFDKVQFVMMQPFIYLTPKHKRFRLIGFSGTIVSGQFLLKSDIAYAFEKALMRDDIEQQIAVDPTGASVKSWKETDTIRGMIGLNYNGITDLDISTEAFVEHVPDYKQFYYQDENTYSVSCLMTYYTLNNALNYNLMYRFIYNNYGHILRLTIDYEIMDALEISGGIMQYITENENSILYPYRNKDNIFMSIKYSF